MDQHAHSNAQGEAQIYKRLIDVAEAQGRIPELESKLQGPALGNKQLNATVTILKSTYSDLLTKIENLEEAVGLLKIQGDLFYIFTATPLCWKSTLLSLSFWQAAENTESAQSTNVEKGRFPLFSGGSNSADQSGNSLRGIWKENAALPQFPSTGHPLGMTTALLIICSNRPEYLERTLTKVVEYHPKWVGIVCRLGSCVLVGVEEWTLDTM